MVSENSLIVQSRFMLLEALLIFFMLLAFFSYLRFHNSPSRSGQWVALTAGGAVTPVSFISG